MVATLSALRTRNLFFRDQLLPFGHLPTPVRMPPRGSKHTSLTPETMQIALRRRLRLPLLLAPGRCGSASEPACGRRIDAFGHALACPRTGLLARRAKLVERVWCKVAREAVGPEGHVVP